MIKILFILSVAVHLLFAQAFNFTELRYSDATDKSTLFEGEIGFSDDGLKIYYPKTDRFLEYENDSLTYTKEGEIIELGSRQAGYIMKYFDILKLVHYGNEESYKEMFSIEKDNVFTILTPIGEIKNYILHVELLKEENKLKSIKLYMKNNDYIKITIYDEIQ